MDMQEEIAKAAYELYEKSGCTPGREVDNWLQAEKIVMARCKQGKETGKKASPPKAAAKPAQKKASSRP